MSAELKLPAFVSKMPLVEPSGETGVCRRRDIDPYLESGLFQAEALELVRAMLQTVKPVELRRAFSTLVAHHPNLKIERRCEQGSDRLFITTLALVMLVDLAPIAPAVHCLCLTSPRLRVELRNTLHALAKVCETNLLQQLMLKGDLSLHQFLLLYGSRAQLLATQAAIEDNAEAFAALYVEDKESACKGIAKLPYDPNTTIRARLGQSAGEIDSLEMRFRVLNQIEDVYRFAQSGLIDRNRCGKPCINSYSVFYARLPAFDHGCGALAPYRRTLKSDAHWLLSALGNWAAHCHDYPERSATFIKKLIRDFEDAGTTRQEIFERGVYYAGRDWIEEEEDEDEDIDDADDQEIEPSADRRDYRVRLLEMSRSLKGYAVLDRSEASVHLVTLQIDKEPKADLEDICETPEHWLSLYQIYPDPAYIANMGPMADSALSTDLGI